ncbi:hypothetical protein HGM15179_010469 [Zosterops borbonicus]|uniref:Uncharacterized protein n=1 Tax=Zosterops borbonicus TaxID=364589 RepID=A0A8K1GEJ3_9PASS|nr:hypothetical protein HGM15179_010469 [Zosterops borbonicus]
MEGYKAITESPKEVSENDEGLEMKLYEEQLRSLGPFSLEETGGDLIAVGNFLVKGRVGDVDTDIQHDKVRNEFETDTIPDSRIAVCLQ